MNAALPLARSVGNSVLTKSSRIPHLEYHILRKYKSRQATSRPCWRNQSTLTTAIPINADTWVRDSTDDPTDTGEEREVASSSSLKPSPLTEHQANAHGHLPLDATTSPHTSVHEPDIFQLLDEACPERLLSWLTTHSASEAFILHAPDPDFERAFSALNPAVLIDPFKRIQKLALGSKGDDALPRTYERSLVRRQQRFIANIDSLLVKRQEAGRALTPKVCRHALECAAAAGDASVADAVWTKLMPASHVQPDIASYNAYMHAHVWNLAYSEISRLSFRHYQRNAQLREQRWRPKHMLGYSVSEKRPDRPWTLRGKILAIFQALSADGLQTTEETFTTMMIGMARAGDIAGVESILKSVWNIDVNALSTFDEEEVESPTFYHDTHPLRPTENLLFAIVHAYCINSNTPRAWSVLDYVSRNYAISIPEHVWDELYEWNFVLSVRIGEAQRRQGQDKGRVPLYALETLHIRASDEPYNLKPNAFRLHMLAKNMRQRRVLDKTLQTVRSLDELLQQHLQQLQLMVDTTKAIEETTPGSLGDGMLSTKFIDFRRDFQMVFLSAQAIHEHLLTHVNRILTEPDWAGSGKLTSWTRQRLPGVLDKFEHYAPSAFGYNTKTGKVWLKCRSRREPQAWSPVREVLREAAVVFEAMSPHDLRLVADNLSRLSESLASLSGITPYQVRRVAPNQVRRVTSVLSAEQRYKP